MDIAAIIALIIGMSSAVIGYMMDGGHFSALIQPTAAIIVFGGTIGATVLTNPLSELKRLPFALKTVFLNQNYDEVEIIHQLADLSEKARKDGLLSLEEDAQTHPNNLIQKGLALVVDGIETDLIKDILERESALRYSIYEGTAKIFESAGGYSPTMGVLGTVMGMVHILSNIGTDTGALAQSIAIAFIATMYGVMFANVVYLPFAGRIRSKAERMASVNELIIEGLLSLQAGENPRIIKEKLNLDLLEKLNGKSTSHNETKKTSEVTSHAKESKSSKGHY